MLVIPIQPVPSQQVLCVLDGQNCQIAIYLKGNKIYVDLNSDGANLCLASLAHNAVPLDACNSYDGFQGNLYFIDTQGTSDPQYTGFGSRWFFVYLTAAEVAETVFVPSAVPGNPVLLLTLSATLDVTTPAAPNFSVAHGFDVVPFLIEIIPTASGSIWGQIGFADATNLYLVGSGPGVTAKILVYTVADPDLLFQTPDATLLVTSPSQPPDTFSVPHLLGVVPSVIEILPTSAGVIWEASPPDATNLYLAATGPGVTVTISVYGPVTGAFNIKGPATTLQNISSAPGAFSLPHGLSETPSRIEILMVSGGYVWAQTLAFDRTNVYLEASGIGVVAKILVYA